VSPPTRVSIDGQDAGDSPVERLDLAPGVHVIRVERPGYEIYERRVRLRPAKTESLRIFLRRVDDGT
jgi:hypothetical protein